MGCPQQEDWGLFYMGLSPLFELDKLQELSADMPPTYHHLSETSRLLCLDLLTRWPGQRWAWRNEGEDLTDAEWDEAQAMVDMAAEELIKTMLTGAIIPFAGNDIPDGFLLCDGSEVSREDYDDLFDIIGVTYGSGNGLTTFNLPNLCGRVPVGQDTGQSEFDVLGETGGEKTHTLTGGEMPTHEHTESLAVIAVVNGGLEAPAPVALPATGLTGPAGLGQAHNNLQPYLTINFIIKT